MDQFLLQAVVTEIAARLLEQEVARVSCLGRLRFVLRFATPGRDNLLLSARPDLPRLHLVRARHFAEAPPDRFSARLDRELAGATLTSVHKHPWDRVVELVFRLPPREDEARARRLVAEITGRAANLLLLDAEGRVLEQTREPHGPPIGPDPEARYAPPAGRDDLADLPAGPPALPVALARFGGAREFLLRVSPLLARDLEAAALDGAEAGRRLGEILEAEASGAWSPVVYSSHPLEEMSEAEPPGKNDLVVSPLPLLAPASLAGSGGASPPVATPFATASEAADAAFGLLERRRDFRDLREHHVSLVKRECDRLEGLQGKLETELAKALRSDTLRRQGEALLAGLRSATLEGGIARVPDPYDSGAPPLEIPIDPALPLPDNARLLFDRYKKGKRGRVAITRRLEAVRLRLQEWRALASIASEARDAGGLERLREEMARLGVVHSARRPKKGEAPRPQEAPARVRSYRSPDGLTILVGRSGEENDTLTFRVASPWDFWLHAADRPGAHVVVRNPKRLATLPERSLRLAAEIAAFHSGARQETKVEVHYTQRKHVHKRKGMPSGQVLLRRFRTVQVAPRLPASTLVDV